MTIIFTVMVTIVNRIIYTHKKPSQGFTQTAGRATLILIQFSFMAFTIRVTRGMRLKGTIT